MEVKQGGWKIIERKWVYVLFGKEEGKENFWVGPRHFPLGPTQNFSLQNGEKTSM